MYIIISYIMGCSEGVSILTSTDGETITFDRRIDAEKYAEKTCAWDYKIIDL